MKLTRTLRLALPRARRGALFVAATIATSACGDDGATDPGGPGGNGGSTSPDGGNSGGTGGADGSGDGGPQALAPTLEDTECDPAEVGEIPPEIDYSCHTLAVPAHRGDRDDGETLRLSVTVLRSPSEDPAPDPIVFLSGGPGDRGGYPNFWATTPFIERGDVILYEQRGTGASEPDMECPEIEAAMVAVFEADGDPGAEEAALSTAAAACADRLTAAGTDLTAFSTPHSADDLEDLRIALGVEQWNVIGLSYGSRLAQHYMRRHPGGIRSVILDSTMPMESRGVAGTLDGADRALDQLVAGCNADTDCAAAHPDLGAEIDALVAQYNADPYRANVDLGGDFGPTDIVITGNDIAAGLFNAMYDHDLILSLPALVAALTDGQTAIADQIAIQGINRLVNRAEGMALATDCTDQAPLSDVATTGELPADVGRWATLAAVLLPQHCDVWPHGEGDPAFAQPVVSDLPVLILSGTADPTTPTPGARTVADALPSSTFVTFESFGHGIGPSTDCSTSIIMSFFDDPTAAQDVSCAASLGPRDFTP